MAAFETERDYARQTLEAQTVQLDLNYRQQVKEHRKVISDPISYLERAKSIRGLEDQRNIYKQNVKRYVDTVNQRYGEGTTDKYEIKVPTSHHTAAVTAATDVGFYRGYVKSFDKQPNDKSTKHVYRSEAVHLAREYQGLEARLADMGTDRHTMRKTAIKSLRDMEFGLNRRAHAIRIGSMRYLGSRQKASGDRSLKAALQEMSTRKKSAKNSFEKILYQTSIP